MTLQPDSTQKIFDLPTLSRHLESSCGDGARVVLCHGVFDLLHVGHIKYLNQAKKMGEVLVVSLTSDKYVNKGPNRPAFNEHYRAESIAALECVDYVAVNDAPSAEKVIELIRPDYYVKGKDYKDRGETPGGNLARERSAVEKVGGELVYVEDELFSSSSLINSYMPPFSPEVMEYLRDFKSRHSLQSLEEMFAKMRGMKVLVVGEAIIDQYNYCEAIGKAGKEPVLVSRFLSSEQFIGGSLAIANHLAGFCDEVGVLCSLGTTDSFEGFIRQNLKSNVRPTFIPNEGYPTIQKLRYVEGYSLQKLFEVYTMDDDNFGPGHEEGILSSLHTLLPQYDVILVADYGHGMLSQNAVDLLCKESPYLAVNAQANAGNRGFHTISRYPKADYVSISEVELRLEMRKRGGDALELLNQLLQRTSYSRFTVTRGRNGLLVYDKELGPISAPAFTSSVVDRVGSGDAVLALTSPLSAMGVHPEVIGLIGNVAGSEAVKIVGHRSFLEYRPFWKHLTALLK
jgi:rfaE bifunctional protein nucleotidyltransferase chain/domain